MNYFYFSSKVFILIRYMLHITFKDFDFGFITRIPTYIIFNKCSLHTRLVYYLSFQQDMIIYDHDYYCVGVVSMFTMF